MPAVLVLLVALIARSLNRRDKDGHSKINLEDLLLGDDGRLSKAAIVLLGSFAMTTWLMVYLALTGKMTEGYFAIYGGLWISPVLARLIFGDKSPPTVISGNPA
jgi:hypothetical protein